MQQNNIHKTILVTAIVSIYCLAASAQIKYCYDANGSRTERLLVGNACRHISSKDSTHTKDSVASKAAINYGLSVYPNPATTGVTVTITKLKSGEEATIYLLNASGDILYTHKAANMPMPINLQKDAAGVYFVKAVIGKDTPLFYRVVKTR